MEIKTLQLGHRKQREGMDMKNIGAAVPLSTDQYLTLYAIHQKMSKTAVIQDMIDGWVNSEINKGKGENSMLLDIRTMLQKEWDLLKLKKIYTDEETIPAFHLFKIKIGENLEKKGISINGIETLLKLSL